VRVPRVGSTPPLLGSWLPLIWIQRLNPVGEGTVHGVEIRGQPFVLPWPVGVVRRVKVIQIHRNPAVPPRGQFFPFEGMAKSLFNLRCLLA